MSIQICKAPFASTEYYAGTYTYENVDYEFTLVESDNNCEIVWPEKKLELNDLAFIERQIIAHHQKEA